MDIEIQSISEWFIMVGCLLGSALVLIGIGFLCGIVYARKGVEARALELLNERDALRAGRQ